MASQDFIELMTKLHVERYNMLSNRMKYDGMSENPSLTATITLEKAGKQISIQSSEWDFIKYVTELRGVADMTGDYKFARLRDLNQFNVDVEHLIDDDRSKIKKAIEEIRSRKLTREYSPAKLIDEFLENTKNVKDVKFLPLKNDYHYILAAALIESNKMLKMQEMLIKKFPEAKRVIDVTEIIMKGFRPTGNGIKDYRFYRSFVSFDIDVLLDRVSSQIPAMDDTIKEFIRKGKVDADIAIPKSMNIYSRMLELSAPVINLLRTGSELKRGVSSPLKYYGLARNIEILKSDTEYGTLFGCLDEQIRHSDAHASIRIDKATRKVSLIDDRSGKGKIVRVYTFDELVNMINTMENEFFPAIYPTLVLFDITMLDLLLVSREYKLLLLALGNY